MTTRKHKPAARKRAPTEARKPLKVAAAEKAVAPVATARDSKERARQPERPRKPGAEAAPPAAPVTETKSAAGAKNAGDKKPLGIERRVPVMTEDRQSQLKLLIARGKEQGYLTYAQVNDHLPSEIVDPEQIEDIVNT